MGGVELGKYTPIGERYFWDASLFIDGGGGASQVLGDGLMLRPQLQFGIVTEYCRIGAGIAYTSVSGSVISTPSFGLTLSRPLDLALLSRAGQQGGKTEFSTMRASYRPYFPASNSKRNGAELQTMHLIGAEMVSAQSPNVETFIMAHGAIGGDAEGYADWLLGQRYFLGLASWVELGLAAIRSGWSDLAIAVGFPRNGPFQPRRLSVQAMEPGGYKRRLACCLWR